MSTIYVEEMSAIYCYAYVDPYGNACVEYGMYLSARNI
jgi:hypothetical protein